MGGMAILPSPLSLLEFGRTAVGQVLESAASLVDALDLARVPRPLDAVLAHV